MTQPDLDKVRLAAAVRVECEEAGHPGCQFPQCACPSTPNRVRAVIAAWEAGAPKPATDEEIKEAFLETGFGSLPTFSWAWRAGEARGAAQADAKPERSNAG